MFFVPEMLLDAITYMLHILELTIYLRLLSSATQVSHHSLRSACHFKCIFHTMNTTSVITSEFTVIRTQIKMIRVVRA